MTSAAQNIFQLVYISQASENLSYKDIENILTSSKNKNEINNITGVLIHRDGFFIQLLEGENESSVKEALSRIIQDPRHNTLRVICEWQNPERLFSEWKMGFCDSDLQENNPHFDFIHQLFSDAMLVTLPNQAQLIQFFSEFSKCGTEIK